MPVCEQSSPIGAAGVAGVGGEPKPLLVFAPKAKTGAAGVSGVGAVPVLLLALEPKAKTLLDWPVPGAAGDPPNAKAGGGVEVAVDGVVGVGVKEKEDRCPCPAGVVGLKGIGVWPKGPPGDVGGVVAVKEGHPKLPLPAGLAANDEEDLKGSSRGLWVTAAACNTQCNVKWSQSQPQGSRLMCLDEYRTK